MPSTDENITRVRKAIEAGEVTHSRHRRIGGPCVCVYVRDSESPTGVRLLSILDDDAETARLLGPRFSALSPTEGLRG